jgi:hypothetical protein
MYTKEEERGKEQSSRYASQFGKGICDSPAGIVSGAAGNARGALPHQLTKRTISSELQTAMFLRS